MKRAKRRLCAGVLPRHLAGQVRAIRRAHKHRNALVARERACLDTLLAGMQQPGQREAMQRAFAMTPGELGKAAIAEARRRAILSGLGAMLGESESIVVCARRRR